MKLKKIASLMLAGVMAVSMLAGCKGSANSGEEENPVVPTTGIVADANGVLTDDQKEIFSYVGSTNLDTILKEITADTKNLSEQDIASAYKKFTAGTQDTELNGKLRDKLEGLKAASGEFTNAPANGKSQSYGWVYTISGKMTQTEAVEATAEYFARYMDNKQKVETVVDYNGAKYNAEYSVEISAVKASNNSNVDGESAWVIAFVVTQTLGDKVVNNVG
ncbi:hypothetical protein [Faecalibacterium sp. An121]|uniref:hypothetical protein n=1 Tax=Faecalibacterium sp. An121 TaxID=1965550 RepID=UPI000B3931D8|nr:hypothetical protein [Faecalibacterium sp. An121]OUQ33608.1 hypothetical protein B5E66_12640 [Faecalibacterium sp. An121]